MARKRFSPEQVISKLREGEVLLAQGQATAEMCRSLGVTEYTYYRWPPAAKSMVAWVRSKPCG